MRNVEEISLKEGINKLNKLLENYSSLNELMEKGKELDIPSLQDISFSRDKKRLESFSSILNVLFSIANKPFSLNKREEIIESSSKASGLSSEAVRKTLQDSSLWKRYGEKMLPEQVYYFQYYDELITYENVFVITFIEMLGSELEKYLSFYVSLLKVLSSSSSLNIPGDSIDSSLKEVIKMNHKVDKIKNTSFYKRVSKSPKRIKNVIPTNILLRNERYNTVYKFYKNMIAYEDSTSLNEDLSRYYYILILKELSSLGYKIRSTKKLPLLEEKKIILPEVLHLKNKEHEISISYLNSSFVLEMVEDKEISSILLTISPNEPFFYKDEGETYDGYDYLSLWHFGYKKDEDIKIYDSSLLHEEELVSLFLRSHYFIMKGSEDIYSKYCPVCAGESLKDIRRDTYYCEDCGSSYHISSDDKILFINRRRK